MFLGPWRFLSGTTSGAPSPGAKLCRIDPPLSSLLITTSIATDAKKGGGMEQIFPALKTSLILLKMTKTRYCTFHIASYKKFKKILMFLTGILENLEGYLPVTNLIYFVFHQNYFFYISSRKIKRRKKQCCGSETIYSGSGSSFEFFELRIRLQAQVPDPCGSGSNLY